MKIFSKWMGCALTLVGLAAPGWARDQCTALPSQYSAIAALCDFQEGMASFKINGRWGFFNLKGEVAIAPQFDEVSVFSEGLASAQRDEKWGVIDASGQWVVAPKWARQPGAFSTGLANVCEDEKCGYIDRKGEWAIAPHFYEATPFVGSVAVVKEKSYAEPHILIDTQGRVLKRFAQDEELSTHHHVFGLIGAKKLFPRVLRHLDGRQISVPTTVPQHHGLTYGEGLLMGAQSTGLGDEAVDLFGATDLNGTWVVKPQFKSMEAFKFGTAIVKIMPQKLTSDPVEKEEQWMLIDKQGKPLLPTPYASIKRLEKKGFMATGLKHEFKDVLNAQGRLLLASGCADLTEETQLGMDAVKHSTVFQGCEQTWVVTAQDGVVKSAIKKETTASANEQFVLLVEKAPSGGDPERDDKPRRFELYNRTGKLVFSSASATVSGEHGLTSRYDDIELLPIAPKDALALPLALLIKGYKTVCVITPDFKRVCDRSWEHDTQITYDKPSPKEAALEGPMPMKTQAGWGAIQANGTWAIQPKYRRLGWFSSRMAYVALPDVYDSLILTADGREHVLPENTGGFKRTAPFELTGTNAERLKVRFNVQTGQVLSLKTPLAPSYADIPGDIAPMEKEGLWGLMNGQGEWLLAPQFTSQFEAVLKNEKFIGWKSARSFQSSRYTEAIYGWVSPQGKELAKPKYTRIDFLENAGVLKIAQEGEGEGLMTLEGQVLIEPVYQSVLHLGDGWFELKPKELHGLLNPQGEWVFEPVAAYYFSSLSGKRPFDMRERHGEKILMDIEGRVSTKAAPATLKTDQPEWWWHQVKKTENDNEATVFYGFDFKERLRTVHRLGEYDSFSEGVIAFKPQNPTPTQQVGLMDSTGRVLGMYPFDEIKPMREGFAVYSSTRQRSHKSKEEPTSLFGYLNRQGQPSLPAKFEWANDFFQGRAVVVLKGNFALIDTQGKLVAHTAWQCGKNPVILDRNQKIVWPLEAQKKRKC
jgi:hypothetical protein